jgi:hypothetical protein
MTGLAFASAAELAAVISSREVSAVEVVHATLAHIGQSQSTLNAFITVAAEPAMDTARAAERFLGIGPPAPSNRRPDCKHQLSRTRGTVQSAANLQQVPEKFSIWLWPQSSTKLIGAAHTLTFSLSMASELCDTNVAILGS